MILSRLMWRRLALVLFATCALWADVCDGLPTRSTNSYVTFWPPKTGIPPPRSYRLGVKEGGPAFRITITTSPSLPEGIAVRFVHAGDIEVARCQDGNRLQSLPFMAWQPIDFGNTFQAVDINFDGYLDFSVLTEYAAKWGSRSYWIYDPASGRFVQNELTRELGENCLGSEWHGGCWKSSSIEFHPQEREIQTFYFVGVGQCGLGGDRYRVEDNRLVVVHKEVLDMNSTGCTLTISDLVAGAMRVTQVRRFDARGQPLK